MPILISICLILLSAGIHYETLWRLNRLLPRLHLFQRRAAVLVAILGATLSHLCQIMLFATSFFVMNIESVNGLIGHSVKTSFSDFLYFSMETYTSLGFGEVIPLGPLRLLVGIESITGLLMISWTASFTFFEMQKYWNDPDGEPRA